MKSARFESKKIVKTTKIRRVAGMQIRSGIKAGALKRQYPLGFEDSASVN